MKSEDKITTSPITRRDFVGASAGAIATLASGSGELFGQSSAGKSVPPPIDIAEWSYFWLGVERAKLARGTVVNGTQMYVEYWIPTQVKHPYPIVMVHGGGGQGTDWMGTPDGRPAGRITFWRKVIGPTWWIGPVMDVRLIIRTCMDRSAAWRLTKM